MTPDQEQRLWEIVSETHDQVLKIATTCGICKQSVNRHELILSGPNGQVAKVAVLEKSAAAGRWMERLISIVLVTLVAGLLTIAGAGKVAGWLNPIQQEAGPAAGNP